eukprot:TRINITY_DN15_c0_g3_i1.p1 TRINITY_DN15_c0_g3~~TRINITY_DN15_c0_g3_i1.p1  ORF type:complete len:208 (-),score=26.36 TRINITY_DN15_c0_g3_i1:159-782(-)
MSSKDTKEEKQVAVKAKVTYRAPDFSGTACMPDGTFKELSLSQFKGKYLVLFFYPLDFTFVCPTEIIQFDKKHSDFAKLDCAVVGCSIDSEYVHLAWSETPREKGGLGKLSIPLLSDLTRKISKDYDCLLEDKGHSCRATYIIDKQGILRHISMNDPPVGRSVDEVYRLVQAAQYVDKYGEVCPSNWKPGDKTIDPKNKLAFFSKKD